IVKIPGEKAQIQCSHTITNYDTILWYKQLKNGHLELLGYMYKNFENPEKGVKVTMEGNADKNQTCLLTTEALKLSLNSSGVYFCAAS
uniref:Ig-like domain-containing protein n=1 Tax=Nothobranchius furzeri TaxID=105023 RepID=A0A8C6KTX4_NOTFU